MMIFMTIIFITIEEDIDEDDCKCDRGSKANIDYQLMAARYFIIILK